MSKWISGHEILIYYRYQYFSLHNNWVRAHFGRNIDAI